MTKYALILITLTSLLTLPLSSAGQDTVKTSKFVYTTSRLVTAKPVIDGRLDDECWKHGTWAGEWHQFTPDEGAKPTYPTEFNLQYDDRNLYVAFRAFDGEPEKITKMAGGRDQFAGDCMGITLDSYHDYRTGFEFNITAWGQKMDLVLFNPVDWDMNWNAVWKAKAGMEDSAWVAEYEIPLSQLRYSRQKEQVWGMHTWRWISRFSEESNWEQQTKTGPGIIYNFGELRGINDLKKSRRLELMPFTLGEMKTMPEEPGNPFTRNGRLFGGNAGLDAKIGISSNFTVDMTINPDFGQVESDPSVMNLTAFETFYEEKRPFFLEGLTIFDFNSGEQSLFYSRRIGHAPSLSVDQGENYFVKAPDKTAILSSFKLSGTTSKGLSVGVIQSVTANQRALLSDRDGNRSHLQVEPLTSYTVGRIRKGYNSGNTFIGGMITSTNRMIEDQSLEFLANNAFSGGMDLLHHMHDKEFFIDASLTGSYIAGTPGAISRLQESSAHYFQKPGARYLGYDTTRTTLSGSGGKIKFGKGSKGHWKYSTGVTWMSPGFDINDLGYMKSADAIDNENEISYQITSPVSIFHSYDINLEQFNSWNYNGRFLGSGFHLSFESELKNNWTFETNLIYHSNQVDTRILRGGPDMLMPWNIISFGELRTDGSKNITAGIEYEYDVAGENAAKSYTLEPRISIRPARALKLTVSANYTENNKELQYVTSRSYLSGKRYILGALDQQTLGLTLRFDVNITPEFSLQYYGSPFISHGRYSDFKFITNPEAENYKERFSVYQRATPEGNNYHLWEQTEDINEINNYTVENPDFNFCQFRSNMVAKWEYRPGSFLYLVWSGDRTGNDNSGNSSFSDSFSRLGKTAANNIFLIKLNYWFSL